MYMMVTNIKCHKEGNCCEGHMFSFFFFQMGGHEFSFERLGRIKTFLKKYSKFPSTPPPPNKSIPSLIEALWYVFYLMLCLNNPDF